MTEQKEIKALVPGEPALGEPASREPASRELPSWAKDYTVKPKHWDITITCTDGKVFYYRVLLCRASSVINDALGGDDREIEFKVSVRAMCIVANLIDNPDLYSMIDSDDIGDVFMFLSAYDAIRTIDAYSRIEKLGYLDAQRGNMLFRDRAMKKVLCDIWLQGKLKFESKPDGFYEYVVNNIDPRPNVLLAIQEILPHVDNVPEKFIKSLSDRTYHDSMWDNAVSALLGGKYSKGTRELMLHIIRQNAGNYRLDGIITCRPFDSWEEALEHCERNDYGTMKLLVMGSTLKMAEQASDEESNAASDAEDDAEDDAKDDAKSNAAMHIEKIVKVFMESHASLFCEMVLLFQETGEIPQVINRVFHELHYDE